MPADDPLVLDAIDQNPEATADHPDDLTEDEAAAGQDMYLAVDDLDDDSNGLRPRTVMSGHATALERARKVREVLLDHGVPEVSIELKQGRPSGTDRWNTLNPVGVLSPPRRQPPHRATPPRASPW